MKVTVGALLLGASVFSPSVLAATEAANLGFPRELYNTTGFDFDELFEKSKRADKVALRILPLGASITWGTLSTDQNGQVH